LVNGSLDT